MKQIRLDRTSWRAESPPSHCLGGAERNGIPPNEEAGRSYCRTVWQSVRQSSAGQSQATALIENFGVGRRIVFAVVVTLLAMILTTGVTNAQTSPLHPTFPLLDEAGENVLDSGQPVSTMETCGTCHDTDFIASHSFHTSVGLDDFGAPGALEGSRPWEMSPGLFGAWDPLAYRTLSPAGDEIIDLGTPDWIKVFGERHVGGTGLGLAIAKALVHMQKGELRLESEPGHGAEFLFTLPQHLGAKEGAAPSKKKDKAEEVPWWKKLLGMK
jgi:hypothetical protein